MNSKKVIEIKLIQPEKIKELDIYLERSKSKNAAIKEAK